MILTLFLGFLKIGFLGFGGGVAMLPVIFRYGREIAGLSQNAFDEMVALSQVTPGPLSINAATYIGYVSKGFGGALAATIGVVLPSFVLVIITSHFIETYKNSLIVKGALDGVRPIVVALMAVAAMLIGKGTLINGELIFYCITIGTMILSMKFKVSPIVIIIGAGIIGALWELNF